MKKLLMALVAILLCVSCGNPLLSGGGEAVWNNPLALREATPEGMVLIGRGSFNMGLAEEDSLWGYRPMAKNVSVESFWMDETEVTNAEYRKFVYWVRDSIIRERLADPAYGGNELYKITEDKYGEPVTPFLDWNRAIPWRHPDEDEQAAIESIYSINPVTGEKKLDARQMNFKYEWYDYASAALRRNNPYSGMAVMISKDTAYISEDGRIVNETITRPLSGPWDFLNTYIVNIYPDETCWINDFRNACNEPYMRLYFTHPGYDDYPVVGVSWEQATAYCAWRTHQFRQSRNGRGGQLSEPFRLPTEAEWEYAARAGRNENKYPWDGEDMLCKKGCFRANFKPGKGNYVEDGHLITARTGSFLPNKYGVYDMAGNVAEWTSTAYQETGLVRMNDINPDLQYRAAKEDPAVLKRKVVRGGSWKDIARFVRSDMRTFGYQDEAHAYIGFRCVRTQVGFAATKRYRK